jgi:hypothetical protein
VAGATHFIAEASDAAPDGGVRFLGESSVVAGAFSLGQGLNFESLAYIADCYGELRPLHGAAPAPGNEPPCLLLRQDSWEQILRFWPTRSGAV